MGQRSVHRAALGCADCAVSGMPRAIAKAGGLGTRVWSRRPICRPIGEDPCDRGPGLIVLGAKLTDGPDRHTASRVDSRVCGIRDWN
jgi:hypothetical protein